jgi:hypothetical protein
MILVAAMQNHHDGQLPAARVSGRQVHEIRAISRAAIPLGLEDILDVARPAIAAVNRAVTALRARTERISELVEQRS